jgi:hypothetical protein
MRTNLGRRLALLGTIALAVVACESEPLAPVSAATSEPRASAAALDASADGRGRSRRIDHGGPLTQFVFLPCSNGGAGESVRVQGEVRYRGNVIEDGPREHLNLTVAFEGTGTGTRTGRVFEVWRREHEVFNIRREGHLFHSGTARWTNSFHLTDLATGESFRLEWTARLVVTPDGELVVDEMESIAHCD